MWTSSCLTYNDVCLHRDLQCLVRNVRVHVVLVVMAMTVVNVVYNSHSYCGICAVAYHAQLITSSTLSLVHYILDL